jgi:septal ring factor EnvC (AmiA/AmiB activator)
MSEEDFDLSRIKESIDLMREMEAKMAEKLKSLSREVKDLTGFRRDVEARMRVVESKDFEEIRQNIYIIESKMKSLEMQHDDRKETWKIALNFVVQLVWVSMAAWLLTKLGLQGPL